MTTNNTNPHILDITNHTINVSQNAIKKQTISQGITLNQFKELYFKHVELSLPPSLSKDNDKWYKATADICNSQCVYRKDELKEIIMEKAYDDFII